MRKLVVVSLCAVSLLAVGCVSLDGVFDVFRQGPRLEGVESLLLSGRYNEVTRRYHADNPPPGYVHVDFDATIKFLRELDPDHRALLEFSLDDIQNVRPAGTGLLIGNRVVQPNKISDLKPSKFPPFSPAFFDEIERRWAETLESYNRVVAAYNEFRRAEAERTAEKNRQEEAERARLSLAREASRAREQEQRAARLAREEREAEARRRNSEERERQRRALASAELARLRKAAVSAGYSGFKDINILKMIVNTQRDGGLEDYLGMVIGCGPAAIQSSGLGKYNFCDRWYPNIQILQVGDEMNLFRFHTNSEFMHSGQLFFVQKEPGVMYQEGQSINGRFHVFEGTRTYTTALGGTRTVPVFRRVDL